MFLSMATSPKPRSKIDRKRTFSPIAGTDKIRYNMFNLKGITFVLSH